MRFLTVVFIAIQLLLANSGAQIQERRQRYMNRAEVRQVADSATVSANSARPLSQAMVALSEEFAWMTDFEDPPYYSKYDLVDDAAPEWRAAHPNARVTVIAGDGFQTQFPKTPAAVSSQLEQEGILNKVVSDYNESPNPGRFRVRDEGDGRFAIVGTVVKDENGKEQTVVPILDTPISVQTDTRDAMTTMSVILDALTAKSQTKVVPGTMPLNALFQSTVTIGGENIPARDLLLQTISATKFTLYWHLYYDNDVKMYALNLLPLRQAQYDALGNRTTIDIWKPKRSTASTQQ